MNIDHIIVVGYYDHHNLGDEQYKSTIPFLLKRVFYRYQTSPVTKPPTKLVIGGTPPPDQVVPAVQFVDCDRLDSFVVPPRSAVILGGGDVLNTYFLNKIRAKFASQRPVALIALSVGIPYNDVYLKEDQRQSLNLFDHIFLRTRQDTGVLAQYLSPEKVHYLPDTSCLVLDYIERTNQFKDVMTQSFRYDYQHMQAVGKRRKIIGVMLCRHIYSRDPAYREQYNDIVCQLAVMVERLIRMHYLVVLVPFNTKPLRSDELPDTNQENDTLIQRDVLKHVHRSLVSAIISFDFKLSLEQTILLYKSFYLTIPMRFHATLFSVYTRVPMIPIFTTKKIKNFLLDIGWTHQYVLDKNAKDIPTQFVADDWFATFHKLTHPDVYLASKKLLMTATQEFKQVSFQTTASLRSALCGLDMAVSKEGKGGLGLEPLALPATDLATDLIPDATDELFAAPHFDDAEASSSPQGVMIQQIHGKLQAFAAEHGFDDFRDIHDSKLQQVAVCVVSYYLTQQLDSPYNHGLVAKMFQPNYNYYEEWKWIWEHRRRFLSTVVEAEYVGHPLRDKHAMRFNMTYIDQNDRSGAHRSGWKYVHDAIRPLHDGCANLLLDLYVDRTFHWKHDIFRQIDVVPYRRPWVGFIHHTFDTEFSEYNNTRLLQCPAFLESLRTCRGLIVLSKTLQSQFLQHFQRESANLPPTPVPIFVVQHPTEMAVPKFDYAAFLANSDKKLLHIGGWLRNIFSFYRLRLASSYTWTQDGTERNALPERVQKNIPVTVPTTAPVVDAKSCFPWRKWFKKERPPTHPEIYISPTKVSGKSKLRKVILKGKYMDNYFPPKDVLEQIGASIYGIENTEGVLQPKTEGSSPRSEASAMKISTQGWVSCHEPTTFCSSNAIQAMQNNWIKHLFTYLYEICQDLEIMEYVNNQEYDDLLTKNMVFLHLVDGSAINTLLECFVRNTPVVVNRHPAVVEVLGESYPLYYQDIHEVDALLADPDVVYRAHAYLKQQDKTPYTIDAFVERLGRIIDRVTNA